MRMTKPKSQSEVFVSSFCDAAIDEASTRVRAFLEANDVSGTDVTRCRLSVEEMLGVWQRTLSDAPSFTLTCGKRLGKLYVRIAAAGERVDPFRISREDDLYADALGGQSLLSRLGLAGSYCYRSGVNEVQLSPSAKPRSQLLLVALAIGAALLCGFALLSLPQTVRTTISEAVIGPFFNMLLKLLSTIASPMIFLAVCSGIYSIGDLALLGYVGKRLISKFVLMTYAVLIAVLLLCVWFFPIAPAAAGAGGASGAAAIYQMLLDIVPSDFVTPFINGNAMQVIFLACACGVGILILGRKVSSLIDIVEQIHSVVQLLMSAIGELVPLFVFTCILDLMLSESFSQLGGVRKQLILCVLALAALMLFYALAIWRKTGLPLRRFLKKLLPTFLVAVTTASSAAAFSVNIDTCKNKLGVSAQLTDFSVPLGQVLYMPAGAIAFLLSALCIAEIYGVSMTPQWLIVAVLISGILAIATPPIPGGALSCYTVLFLQLGIPAPGIALAISIDLVMDFLLTACNLFCLQSELTLLSGDMDMLDTQTLFRE